jgi:cytochrome c biogenesis protein CcdA
MDPQKDVLAELDLAGLFAKRAEAVEKKEEAEKRLRHATAAHLVGFWLGACAMALAALWIAQVSPEQEPLGVFWFAASAILCFGAGVVAFFPSLTVRRRQDRASAASRTVKAIDDKIAFCHQVLEEAKKVKVRRYAEVWVAKETHREADRPG